MDEMLKRYEILCDEDVLGNGIEDERKLRGIYYKTTSYRSGKMLEIESYPMLCGEMAKQVRKIEVSREAQKKLNQKNAEKKMLRLAEANFGEKDYKVDVTFEGEELPTLESVQKEMAAFINRINYRRKKNGIESVKYIYVIEGCEEGSRKKRLHAHMIIDGLMDGDEYREIWGKGRCNVMRLDPNGFGGLKRLVSYMSKDPKGKKRWCSSRNLIKPTVTVAKRKISSRQAQTVAEDVAGRKAFLEKKYPGYIVDEVEVKTNPYIPGFYIYAMMHKKPTESERRTQKARKAREIETMRRKRHEKAGAD